MKRVFISYSRNNADIVLKLVNDLQMGGITVWYDQTLTGGQRWWDNILANIRNSDLFLFALSPESWDSEACRSELNYVVQLGKTILPVLISEGININLLSPPLNEIQITDYRRGDKDAVLALIRSIYSVPATPPLPDPLPEAPRIPVSYLSNLKERIDSTEPLSANDQITILFELEEKLQEERSAVEVRDLLLRVRRRDDLLAKIASKIDAALKTLEDKVAAQLRAEASFLSPPPIPTQQERYVSSPSPVVALKSCPRCGTKVELRQQFCGTCGAGLNETKVQAPVIAPPTQPLGAPAAAGTESISRRYLCTSENAPRLIAELKAWLDSQDFDSQQMVTDNQSQLLQIKKRGGWRNLVGMSTSLNIVLHHSADTLTVQIGAGKWIDKATVGTVSLFILWPLAITAGLGAWEQMKLPDKIFDFVSNRLVYK